VVGLVNAAAACAFLATRWHPILLIVGVPLALVTAIPMLFDDARRFRAACWWVVGTLVLVQLPLVFFGVAMFLPGAVLLALAAVAPLDRLPFRAKAAAVAILALMVVSGWSYAVYTTYLETRDTYMVLVPHLPDKNLLMYDGSGIGYGARYVSYSSDRVWVGFRPGMSQADQDALQRRLSQIMPPGSEIVHCYGQRC
jgi:hypothetical protein